MEMAKVVEIDHDKAERTHSYATLKGPRHIRIIVLEPSLLPYSPIRFSFQQTDVDHAEDQFEAISYVWGQPLFTHTLHCTDGSRLNITSNLHACLRRIRLPIRPRHIWADAVCINQANDVEKSLQIALMGHIYRKAKRVLACLGETRGEEEGVLAAFSQLSRCTDLSLVLQMAKQDRILQAITTFVAQPYFGRRWIIQEMVLNLEVTVLWGESEFPWSRVDKVLQTLDKNLIELLNGIQTSPQEVEQLQAIAQVYSLRRRLVYGPSLDGSSDSASYFQDGLLSLLETFHQHGCGDPRDRIFALYGLATDGRTFEKSRTDIVHGPQGSPVPFSVDYSADVKTCYHSFASTAMLNGNAPALLRSVCRRGYGSYIPGLQSWVPNWHAPVRYPMGRHLSIDCMVNFPWGPWPRHPRCRFEVLHIGPEGYERLTWIIANRSPAYWPTDDDHEDIEFYKASLSLYFRRVWPSLGISQKQDAVEHEITSQAQLSHLSEALYQLLADEIHIPTNGDTASSNPEWMRRDWLKRVISSIIQSLLEDRRIAKVTDNEGRIKDARNALLQISSVLAGNCMFVTDARQLERGYEEHGTLCGIGSGYLAPGDEVILAGTCISKCGPLHGLILRPTVRDRYKIVGHAWCILLPCKICNYKDTQCRHLFEQSPRDVSYTVDIASYKVTLE